MCFTALHASKCLFAALAGSASEPIAACESAGRPGAKACVVFSVFSGCYFMSEILAFTDAAHLSTQTCNSSFFFFIPSRGTQRDEAVACTSMSLTQTAKARQTFIFSSLVVLLSLMAAAYRRLMSAPVCVERSDRLASARGNRR